MRGGTGKAFFFHENELASDLKLRDKVVLDVLGSPDIRQIVASNQFKIAGGTSGMEVSWQVTGIRQDAWASTHAVEVEQEKPEKERGYYLHPEVFGQAEEMGVQWALRPEAMRQMKEEREKRLEGGNQPS
jgi:hypothetical protein